MGFSLRRGIAALATGGLSELAGGKRVEDFMGGPSPWNDRGPAYQTPDPRTVQWDPETGMPIGLQGPPSAEWAPMYQYRGQEITRQQNARQRRAALAYLEQGSRISESFRPGGYAGTVGAGFYRDRANVAMSSMIDEPDLLWDYRRDAAAQARREAKKAARLRAITSAAGPIIGAAVTMAGNALGGAAAPGAPGGEAAPMGAQNARGETMLGPGWGKPTPQQPGILAGNLSPLAPPPGVIGVGIGSGAEPGRQQSSYLGPPSGMEAGGQQGAYGGGTAPGGGGGPAPGKASGGAAPSPGAGGEGGGDQPGQGQQAGAGGPQQGGADPYFLAETLHYNQDDGFLDGLERTVQSMLADRMADYGVMA